MYMLVKKKIGSSVHTAIAEPPAPLEEEAVKEVKRPPVTQVVEVVEEVEEVPSSPAVPPEEEAVAVESPVQNETQESSTTDSTVEKRKELVDEIFQKTENRLHVVPEISMHTKKQTPAIFLWAIGIVVACLVIGGALFFMTGKSGSLPSVVVVPTPTSTPAASESATPTIGETKRSAITIQVLNGGGKAGAATKMKQYLEDKGYTVSDTGNAESYTYDKTEILVKSTKSAYITLLETDLKGTYTLGTSAATLETDVSYDARVIVGKE
jgi:hypothetical protein